MQEIKELNQLLSKYVDDGFYPGIQWQINLNIIETIFSRILIIIDINLPLNTWEKTIINIL